MVENKLKYDKKPIREIEQKLMTRGLDHWTSKMTLIELIMIEVENYRTLVFYTLN